MMSCILCKSSKKDDVQYGEFLQNERMGVHTFCLYLSSNLAQNGKDDEGFLGFLEADIYNEVKRTSFLKCCYCRKWCANIGCCGKKCRRAFHFICGLENNAGNEFCHEFRSFCNRHVIRGHQRPSSNEHCLICYDSIFAADKKFNSVKMILTPCCRNGWFHKLCLQKFAKTAGYYFKCPLCNDDYTFREKLPTKGIFIPNQDAAWELEPNAFAELLETPSECIAKKCNNKKGRKASSNCNPFVMCHTCGSTAKHQKCLPKGDTQFLCVDCASALEGGDSGRESLILHANYGNEDESIDVCHLDDKEDLDIKCKLKATNNQIVGNERDSGIHHDIDSSIQMFHKSRICINDKTEIFSNSDTDGDDIKPSSTMRRRCLRIGSKDSDLPHATNVGSGADDIKRSSTMRTKRLRIGSKDSDLPHATNVERDDDDDDIKPSSTMRRRSLRIGSKDSDLPHATNVGSGADDIRPSSTVRTKRLRIDSESIDISENEKVKPQQNINTMRLKSNTESSETKDNSILKSRKVTSPNIFDSSESDGQEECSIEIPEFAFNNDKSKISDSKTITEKLENEEDFVISFGKRKCWNVLSDSEGEDEHFSKQNILDCKIDGDESDEDDDDPIENFSKCLNKKILQESHRVSEKENKKCEANTDRIQRTRRSTFVDLKPVQKSPKKVNFDISCIARRTRRRKSMACSNNMRTEKNQKENSSNSSCSAIGSRRKTICAQTNYSKESLFQMSQFYEKLHESNESIEISDDDGSEFGSKTIEVRDSRFDISCIANRTRKRKKLEPKGNHLPKIDEVIDSSLDSPSSSKNSQINSFSSKELGTATTQSKTASSVSNSENRKYISLLLDKMPQPKYNAFLQNRYPPKPCSSNSINNYHHANYQYSNNRDRF